MGSSDKIESAISEIRAQKIKSIDAIDNYLIDRNFSLERQAEFYKRLQDNYDNEYTSVVTRWISKNMKTLIDREPRALILILESRVRKGYLDNICLDSQKLNTDDLIKMDKFTKDDERKAIKMINGCILGEIGIRDNEYFMQALTRISDTDEENKISFLRAISIVSNRFRNPNFVPTEELRTFIIECAESSNKELSRHGIFDSIALFEYDIRFKEVISEYFHESEKNRIDVYDGLNVYDLRDQDFELSLLGAKGSESSEEIKILMWVLGSKIFRSQHLPDSYIDRSKLQSHALDFIHKVFSRSDIQLQQFFSSSVFTEIGNMDVGEAFRYLVTWLTNEPIDPIKHEIVYPRLINDYILCMLFSRH